MSDVHQPGKERPARPPKPSKPQRPATTADIPSTPLDTGSLKRTKPAAPPKPKKPPSKKLGKSIASRSQEAATESDESGSTDSNLPDNNVKGAGSPSGSPKVPPRKHKKPIDTDQLSPKDGDLGDGKVEVNGTSEATPEDSSADATSKPVREERPSVRQKPPPPKKLTRQDLVEEEQLDSEKHKERRENGNPDETLADDRLKGVGNDEADSGNADRPSNGDSPSTGNIEGTVTGGKKVALKPRPSRPPPPQKRPSHLSRGDSSISTGGSIRQQSPQTRPKPPKPQKIPTRNKNVEDGEQLNISGGGSGQSTQGLPEAPQPHRPPRRRQTLDLSGSMDEKSVDDKEMVAQTVVEDQHQDSQTPVEPRKPKPGRPLPPPKVKPHNITASDRVKAPTSAGDASPISPSIPVDEKRRSNGSMYVVVGTAHANGEVVAEEPVTMSSSQLESRDAPASRDQGEIKPARPAPKKPPPPHPVLLKQRSTVRESPTSSPSHKKPLTPGGSPRRQDSQRPSGLPPPPPPTKRGGVKDSVERVASHKTPPKRPPPVMKKKPLASSTPLREDKSGKSSEEETVPVESSNGEVLPASVGGGEIAPTEEAAEDGLSGSEKQSEPIKEGESNGPVSITVEGEDGVTTPTGGPPVGPDDVFAGDRAPGDQLQRDSQISVQDLDSSFDDEDDDFSDFSEGENSIKSEEAPPSDAAFMESLPKMQKKAYQVAKEIRDSEGVFVDVLRLLNEDFKSHIVEFARGPDNQEIEEAVLTPILGYLPQLQMFNEELHEDLKKRIEEWPENPKVADIFIKKGPFLKLFTTYIQDFEKQTAALEDTCSRYPHFKDAVKKFEASSRCQNLHISHYMLKPIQRIPQYRLLLSDYQKNLESGSVDDEDTKKALDIVSEVAQHVNEFMKKGDDFNKLLNIQHSLIGQHHIVQPGRTFIKEGDLHKISRKEFQQRKLFLMSDTLLMTAPTPAGLKLKREFPLADLIVTEPTQTQDHENEFNIISREKSCTVAASSPEEKEEWVTAITDALTAVRNKNKSFNMNDEGTVEVDSKIVLGQQAPVWIPDKRVSMCMVCTVKFTLTNRRHHCRACGKIVCGDCSSYKVMLEYVNKEDRVCDECYRKLGGSSPKVKRKKSHIHSPKPASKLTEVKATEYQDITMKGYLEQKERRSFKQMWFVIKDKVLYTYKASEDVKAQQTFPLLGFEVTSGNGEIQLKQHNITLIFRTGNEASAEQWTEAFKKAATFE